MTQDSVIYTDGHGVKVTTYQFVAGEVSYMIEGIISARMNLIKAKVLPAVLLVLAGVGGIAAGFFHLLSGAQINDLYLGTMPVSMNRLAGILGIILVTSGLIWLAAAHTRYAVHITTAEGEKEPVVSTKKDYIKQIVNALNNALAGK